MSNTPYTLPHINLLNRTILVDVSHARKAGDELKTDFGMVIGKVEHSEIPSWGVVVQVSDDISEFVQVGDILPLPAAGILRQFEWPDRPASCRVLTVRFDSIDGVVRLKK